MSLISNRIRGWRDVEALASAGAAALLFSVWLGVFEAVRGAVNPLAYAVYGILIVSTTLLFGLLTGKRNSDVSAIAKNEVFGPALGQTLTVVFVLMTYLAATQDAGISRIFLFSFLPAFFIAMIAVRKVAFRWLGAYVYSRRHRCDMLLVGDAEMVGRTRSWLHSKTKFGLEVIGWLSDRNDDRLGETGVPHLGAVRQIDQVLHSTGANAVLVTDLLKVRTHLGWLKSVCERRGARLVLGVDFGEVSPSALNCYQEDGFNLVTVRDEPLESPSNRLMKRLLDIAIALPVVCLMLPWLSLFVWALQTWQSPGPLFFVQERGGRNGRAFRIYKYRSMGVVNDDEARQAVAGDDRVFPAGRWLRKLSIDEFPQFLNVLEGTMSIVGPRPHMLAHDDAFATLEASPYRVRSFIKPGITGLAQVQGFRGPTVTAADVSGRTQSDLYYLEHWSMRLDLQIIFKTVLQMMKHHKNAV